MVSTEGTRSDPFSWLGFCFGHPSRKGPRRVTRRRPPSSARSPPETEKVHYRVPPSPGSADPVGVAKGEHDMMGELLTLEQNARQYEQQLLLHERMKQRCTEIEEAVQRSEENLHVAQEEAAVAGAAAAEALKEDSVTADALPGPVEQAANSDPTEVIPEDFPVAADFNSSIESGVEAFKAGKFKDAKLHFIQARNYAVSAENELQVARAESNICNVYVSENRSEKALVHFRRSLSLLRKMNERDIEAAVLSNGIICCLQIEQHVGIFSRRGCPWFCLD